MNQNILQAMATGHPPFHPLYLFFSTVFNKIFHPASGIFGLTLTSVIFGSVSIIFLYLTVRELFSNKTAWLTAIIYALLPFVYFSQITILVDPVMQAFYFISLYLFTLSFRTKKHFLAFSFFSGLAMGLAAFAHTQVAFWLTGLLAVILLKIKGLDKKSIKRMFLSLVFFALGAGGFIILYAKLLVFGNTLADVGTPNIRAALKYLIFGNISDRGSISVYLTAKYLTMISTTIVVLLSAAGYIHLLLKRKWRAFFALTVWAFPLLVTSAYIYENLHGRAMILGLAPLVIALALFLATLRGWMKIAVLLLVLIQLAVVSFPGVAKYHSQPAPNEDLTKMIANIDQSGVLATSNVTKTWFHYGGKYINFGDVDFGAGLVSDEINKYLQDGKKAYISQDAVYLPTRRYDGLFYDIRSVDIGGASDHKTMLNEIFKAKSIVLSTASERFRQAIYEVQNQPSSDFFRGIASQGNKKDIVFGRILDGDNPISNLNVNIYQRQFCQIESENITRFDFGFCLWRSLSGRIRAVNWMPTDKNGQFAIAENLFNDYQLILAPVSINTWSESIGDEFYRGESTEASPTGEKIFANIGELADFAEGYDGSYYAVKLKGCKQVKMYFIDPEFYRTNRLEAEEMASKVGKIVKDREASSGRVVVGNTPGYLLSGPYINLGRGEYRLEFAVDLQRGTKLRLDVVSAKGDEECTAKNVSGEGKQQFKLRFKLDEPKEDIEFRIEIKSGQAAADYLLLEKV